MRRPDEGESTAYFSSETLVFARLAPRRKLAHTRESSSYDLARTLDADAQEIPSRSRTVRGATDIGIVIAALMHSRRRYRGILDTCGQHRFHRAAKYRRENQAETVESNSSLGIAAS